MPGKAPARVHNVDLARTRFGGLVERMGEFLYRLDPRADAAVAELETLRLLGRGGADQELDEALRGHARALTRAPSSVQQLVEASRRDPVWLDRDRIERAGVLFFRAGIFSALVLGLRSLVGGYAAPAGNKPLALSGRLIESAGRRLFETCRFVSAVCTPGGMRVGADGYTITLKVRLMHARVRALVKRSGRWDTAQWCEPINQHDMMATILLFSKVFIDGLRLLGLRVEPREADDFMHLWRYVGWLIGVDPELLPADEREAQRLFEFVHLTQGPPDDDSRALVDAFLTVPVREATTPEQRRLAERVLRINQDLCRVLIGDTLADGLAIPRHASRHVMPVFQILFAGAESFRARVPGLDRLAEFVGERYWQRLIENGLAGRRATFSMPSRLARRDLH